MLSSAYFWEFVFIVIYLLSAGEKTARMVEMKGALGGGGGEKGGV